MIPEAAKSCEMRLALDLQKAIVLGIVNQAPGGVPFKPLAPMTRAGRAFRHFSGRKRLIVHGDLMRSIKTHWTPKGAFVGVHRMERGPGGKSMVNIAAVHEFGMVGPTAVMVTTKMRRYFKAMFLAGHIEAPLRARTRIIFPYTPASPYMGPTWKKWVPTAAAKFAKIMEKNLR
jgi:hypothetical protein